MLPDRNPDVLRALNQLFSFHGVAITGPAGFVATMQTDLNVIKK